MKLFSKFNSLPPEWCLPLFALLLLLPLAMGEIYVRSLPNPAKYKHAYLSRHSREVEVLILGSSHTYYGLCPERLGENAFSAAQINSSRVLHCAASLRSFFT